MAEREVTPVEYPRVYAIPRQVHDVRCANCDDRLIGSNLPATEAQQLIDSHTAQHRRAAAAAAEPGCEETTVFWPDAEACDAVCDRAAGHEPPHHDPILGDWTDG